MVKYLSDKRNDPYYQTKLSLSDPLQSEVAAETYAVDEVDLTPALSMLQSGARAYYAHQGEELQRENMAISYSTYQANRAEAQARQAKASSKEKEQGLKNTILNDYAAYVNKGIEALNQGVGITSREQLERYIRAGRPMYLENSGAVININDLIGVEKNMGLTLTKDLFQEASEAAKEELKAYKKSVRDSERAVVNMKFGIDNVTGKPVADRFDNFQVANMAAAIRSNYNNLQIYAQTDQLNNKGEPSERTTDSIRNIAYQDLIAAKAGTEGDWTWKDIDQHISVEADQLMRLAAESGVNLSQSDALLYARMAAQDASYFGDVTYSNAMLTSMLNTKKYLSEYDKLDSATALEIEKNMQQLRMIDTSKKIAYGRPVGQGELAEMAINEKYKLADLERNVPVIHNAIRSAFTSVQVTPQPTGTNAGVILQTAVREIPDGAKQQLAQASYEQAEDIYKGNSIFGKYAGTYGAGISLGSIHNEVTTVQQKDQNQDNTKDPNTAQRIENTERLAIPAFRKWYEDGTISQMSEEEQNIHFTNYMADISWAANSRISTLKNNNWLENIRFDPATKRFVVVNVGKDKESLIPTLTGAETLWPQVDALNNYFSVPVEYKGLYSTDAKRDNLIKQYDIKELSKDDKVMTKSDAIKFMEFFGGLENASQISIPGTVTGAVVGGATLGIPGALLGAAIGTAGTQAAKGAWDLSVSTLDAVTGTVSAAKNLYKGSSLNEVLDPIMNSLGAKIGEGYANIAGKGFETMAEMVGEATEKTVDAAYKAGEVFESVKDKLTKKDITEGQPEMLVNAFEKLDYNGNIDIFDRTYLANNDGTVSSLESITIEHDGDYVNIPTIYDGERHSDKEATVHFLKTGEHLGRYNTKKKAVDSAKKISDFEDLRYRWLENLNKIPTIDRRQIIMNNILEGNTEGLTEDDAQRALDYFYSLGPIEKFRLDGLKIFNKNAEQVLKDTVKNLKKK